MNILTPFEPNATIYLQIEKEEEKASQQDPDKQCFHLCIVNLVIGTLYCAKVIDMHRLHVLQSVRIRGR